MRFFARQVSDGTDVRPTLLGVVTLMFLLLFFLLSTSSGQRLGVLDLRLAAPGEAPPLPHSGLVKAVRLFVSRGGARVEFEVASTDVAAAATTRELRSLDVPAKKAAREADGVQAGAAPEPRDGAGLGAGGGDGFGADQKREPVAEDGEGPDLAALSAALSSIHSIDPSQDRIELVPDPDVTTSVLLPVLDVVRGSPNAPIFPKLSVL